MYTLTRLFKSPEFYPVSMDFASNTLQFLQMSRESYRHSVFLDVRTRHLGKRAHNVNLDDVLLSCAGNGAKTRGAHYILNNAFCCSTLLARYFEIFPDCFVLKEPSLLTQLALTPESVSRWGEVFQVCLKLLARTYLANERPVIKVHEACNILGDRLLDHTEVTITFLSTPIRRFVLSILKAEFRRQWVHRRVNQMSKRHEFADLFQDVDVANLSDAQAACLMWMADRLVAQKLSSCANCDRVLVINGDEVADHPLEALSRIAKSGGFALSEQQLDAVVNHPLVNRYSKDMSVPYNAASRLQELERLEQQWGREAQMAIDWMETRKGTAQLSAT
jgi:hypothetical protein